MKSLKKKLAIAASLIVAVVLIAGCSPSEPDCAEPEIFCIGLVTDVGRVDDKAFNQLAWDGIEQAEHDLAAHAEYIETVDSRDFDKNIASFANAGYDVIVTVGSGQREVTTDAAVKYPEINFIGVDQFLNMDKSTPRNLTGLIFPEDQAGFLAGALAAQMTRTGKIGAVCGPDTFPPAWRYGEGFRAGAEYIDPLVEVQVVYHNDIGFNDSLFDPEWDAATANSLIDGEVDVIFGASGYDENGTVTAAAQRGIYAIGVNIDQYPILREAQDALLSSAIKLVASGVFDLIKTAREGNFPGGNFQGQSGYAPFHNLDSEVSPEVKATMDEIQTGLADGSIETEVLPSKP
jgi:basic membrane protein A and related proteins